MSEKSQWPLLKESGIQQTASTRDREELTGGYSAEKLKEQLEICDLQLAAKYTAYQPIVPLPFMQKVEVHKSSRVTASRIKRLRERLERE